VRAVGREKKKAGPGIEPGTSLLLEGGVCHYATQPGSGGAMTPTPAHRVNIVGGVVDFICADDLKLFIDDGGSEVVDCELEMIVCLGGRALSLCCVALRRAGNPLSLLSRRRARLSRGVLAGSKTSDLPDVCNSFSQILLLSKFPRQTDRATTRIGP
jgi:hypothetical protein